MRYEPYDDEYAAVPTMTDEELFEYFLFRILETDEVWGLKQGPHWLTREIDGHMTLPVWPFKRFADDAALDQWPNLKAVADSIDYFMDQTLPKMAKQGVTVEVMPRKHGVGCLVTPGRLVTILEGTRYSAEYTLED